MRPLTLGITFLGWLAAGVAPGPAGLRPAQPPRQPATSTFGAMPPPCWRSGSGCPRHRCAFHQSSHLGDEFLLRRSRVERINLSYEGVDARLSYEAFGDVLRLYAGAGYLVRREPDTLDPWSLQYGVEFRSPWPGPQAAFRPIAATDVQYREENDFSADLSVRAGVQFTGVLPSRDLQLLVEYFNGRSPNGQFYRRKIDYLGIGVHFHF